MSSLSEIISFKKKEKKEPERHEISEYGEPVYQVTHRFSLENYREYNFAVSKDTIEKDKVIKKWAGIILAAIAVVFFVLSIIKFDLFDFLDRGRTVGDWFNYGGFFFYFVVFGLSTYCSIHLLTFYKFFPKRLEKATQDYYNRTPYLTHDLTLVVYENGVMEQAISRDGFFEWELFQRCWDSDNIVYLEFNLANQLFVSKQALADAGIDAEEFMKFCNEHIETARAEAEKREAEEEEREREEEEEYEDNKRQIEELESEDEED